MADEHSAPPAEACLNCGHPLPEDARYCPQCSQERTTGLVRVRDLVKDFFSSVLNIDSLLVHTVRDLFIPGELSKQFFAGKHKSYYTPLRLFFLTLFVFLGVVGLKYLNKLQDTVSSQMSYNEYLMQRNANERIEEAVTTYHLDSLESAERMHVDSFVTHFKAEVNRKMLGATLSTPDTTLFIPMQEIHELTADSILKKYNVRGGLNKLLTRQIIKMQKTPDRMIGFSVGNLTWMLVLLVPAVALIMKLIYIRRRKYYVEHLVFLYHYHALVFLVLTLCVLGITKWSSSFAWILFGSLAAFLFAAMMRFYSQGIFKTIVKILLLLIAYFIALFLFASVTMLLSVLLFP